MTEIIYTRPSCVKQYEKQRQFIDNDSRFTIVEATTKAGKAQPLDAIIKTPSGDKLMGEIDVNDEVLLGYFDL